jgi:hypothetical protein
MNQKLISLHKEFYDSWNETHMRHSAEAEEVNQAAISLIQLLEAYQKKNDPERSVFEQQAAPVNAAERFQFAQERAGHFTGRLEICKLAKEMKYKLLRRPGR